MQDSPARVPNPSSTNRIQHKIKRVFLERIDRLHGVHHPNLLDPALFHPLNDPVQFHSVLVFILVDHRRDLDGDLHTARDQFLRSEESGSFVPLEDERAGTALDAFRCSHGAMGRYSTEGE
jgi:hypothetical protein